MTDENFRLQLEAITSSEDLYADYLVKDEEDRFTNQPPGTINGGVDMGLEPEVPPGYLLPEEPRPVEPGIPAGYYLPEGPATSPQEAVVNPDGTVSSGHDVLPEEPSYYLPEGFITPITAVVHPDGTTTVVHGDVDSPLHKPEIGDDFELGNPVEPEIGDDFELGNPVEPEIGDDFELGNPVDFSPEIWGEYSMDDICIFPKPPVEIFVFPKPPVEICIDFPVDAGIAGIDAAISDFLEFTAVQESEATVAAVNATPTVMEGFVSDTDNLAVVNIDVDIIS